MGLAAESAYINFHAVADLSVTIQYYYLNILIRYKVNSLRTRVKICGITQKKDALTAIQYGADAIGLVFYAPSTRCVSISKAKEIVQGLPPFITVVALFVDASSSEIQEVLSNVAIDLIQFHGDETPEFCQQFNRPFIKAVRVKSETNLVQYANNFSSAKALLLDAYSEGMPGGTGQTFDWQLIPQNLPLPIILAGGLKSENVQQAIQMVKPFAVDVSGGVEISKGIKSPEKIAHFMQQMAIS